MKIKLLVVALAALTNTPTSAAEQSSEEGMLAEEVIVVASRLPVRDNETGKSVSVLDNTQIRNLGYEQGADLLRFVPGMAVSRTGGYGGLTSVRVRGAEDNHVVFMIDGIDVSAAGSGLFDVASLLTADVQRIEVLRGPQSGLYGSNALAGVVSVNTASPREGFTAHANVEMGENDTRHGSLAISGGNSRIQGTLRYTARNTEFDLSEDDSLTPADDDADDNRTVTGQVTAQLTDTISIRAFGRRTDRETDTDGFDFSGGLLQGLAVDDASGFESEDKTFGAIARFDVSERIVAKLSTASTDADVDGRVYGSDSTRRQTRAEAQVDWDSRHSTSLMAEREKESFRNLFPFDPTQMPTQRRTLRGFAVEHHIQLGDLFLTGAARHDRGDDFDDASTFAVTAAWRLDSGRLHASIGTGVTNPTFFEQFGFVPGTFVGNPDLEPEQSRGLDLGYEHSFAGQALTVDVTYFKADLEDEIQSVFPSVANMDGDSQRKGAELTASWNPGANTSVNAAYTYTDADSPGGREIRRPRHSGSVWASHSLLNGRATLSGSLVFNGKMLDDDWRPFFTNGFTVARTELDAYTLVNLKGSYRPSDALELYVRLENALDEDYEEVLSYATPGRTLFAGLRYTFTR